MTTTPERQSSPLCTDRGLICLSQTGVGSDPRPMSTDETNSNPASTAGPDVDEPDDEQRDRRVFPLESAYPEPGERPAWKRLEPDLSGGYIEIHRAMCGDVPIGHEEATSS